MYTRREFGSMALTGLAAARLKPLAAASLNSVFGGVHVGAQTYSFRDLPHAPGGDAIDNVIKALTECGISECELFARRSSRSSAPARADDAAIRRRPRR